MSGNVQGVGAQHYKQQPVVITKQPIIQHVVNLECKRGVQQGLFSRVAEFAVRSCIAGFTAGSMMAACRVAAAHVMGTPSQDAINQMVETSVGMGAALGVFAAFTTSAKGDAALRGMEFGAAGAAVFMAAGGSDTHVLESARQAKDWVVLEAGKKQVEAETIFKEYVRDPLSTLEMPKIEFPDFFESEEKGFVCPEGMLCVSKGTHKVLPLEDYENFVKVRDARAFLEDAGFKVTQ